MSRDGLRSQVAFSMVPVWVLERCSSPAVHVYGLLMKHANRERRAWPKTEVLASMMGKSLRTVERAIAELRHVGALRTTRRHGLNGAVLGLDFMLIQVDPQPAIDGGMALLDHPARSGGKEADHPATGVVAIPPPVSGLKKELDPGNQIQEQKRGAEGAPLPSETSNPLHADDPIEALLIVWNEWSVDPLKPVRSTTPKRRRLIRAWLAEQTQRGLDPMVVWTAVVRRVAGSGFCCGVNSRGWVASFDWLIGSPDPAVKALEGQYDDHVDEVELKAAADWQFRTGKGTGCPHDPPCAGDRRACLRDLALQLRSAKAS